MIGVGLIARANDKGLGIQSWEAWKHLNFAATAVITLKDKRFVDHLDRYPAADVIDFTDGEFIEGWWKTWIDDNCLDVIFSVETLYDWRLADWAREIGCATVVQGNPELWPHARYRFPQPDRWVWPTSWRPTSDLPEGQILPVPVPAVEVTALPAAEGDQLRVLHVGGHRAMEDRNGTEVMFEALRTLRTPVHVTITTQDGANWNPVGVPRNVELELITTNVENRWDLYAGHHLLVMPRRYGGLCLPVQEAMASGLAVAMTATPPNADWPIIPFRARPGRSFIMLGGSIRTVLPDFRAVSSTIDGLNNNRDRLDQHQQAALTWASDHSWEALAPDYYSAFEEASQ